MGIFKKENEKTATLASQVNRSSIQSSASLLHKEGVMQQKLSERETGPVSVNAANFSDLYITPDKKSYVWSGKSNSGLKVADFIDLQEFIKAVVEKYDGENPSYSLHYKGSNYRIERTIALEGEQYCARKMPKSIPELEKLGLPSGIYKQLLTLGNKSGLILLAGATGTGKSTTIAALLKRYLETEGGYAFTIEDPIEYVFKSSKSIVSQRQVGVDTESFEDGIKYALRQDPDVIFVGEIRDRDTVTAALKAAETGHLVFATIHTNDAIQTVNRVINMFEPSDRDFVRGQVAQVLRGTVSQKLVPLLNSSGRRPA